MSDIEIDRLRARIAELEQENFALAAGACIVDGGLVGGEGGSPVCTLRKRIAELERACEVFVTWLDREEAGFANVGARGTPTGEAEWREWYDENLRLCSLAQSLARAAIEKATKP